ncbi:MAG: hypothetical protein DA408_20100 [Bacteroidetes bacterium]|nr:MAG: hypothetical protein C7N36_10855 [Bacteroidota bacterium]PTM08675.1 MAG: hypothetical protein DA408_20100 [Bacteroidota bacterium]
MRETQFIKQNEEKWAAFERTLNGEDKDADHLRDLFVQITDDLSYSRTFFPNRSVRVYLNGLAQRIFLKLYRSRRTGWGQLLTFWTDDLPHEIYQARRAFRLAFFLFFLCFGIGMLSCAMDSEFAEIVLGDSYVEMTRANIESGDPMAVYKEKGQFDMFLGITFNNLYVAFLAFAMGVFLGLGSIVILISNAVMVGCFQYFFIQEGLFWESFLTIWIHGTLEISAIVIATAAGITLGQGPAFPGTYTRLQAFQQSARRGAKIMLGTAPLFLIAGFLEGYLTRQTDTPDLIRGLFILCCLAFVLVYFVWYPWYRHRLGIPPPPEQTQRVAPMSSYHLETGRIKNNGEIFSEVFTIFRRHLSAFLVAIFGGALLYTTLVFGLSGVPAEQLFPFQTSSWLFNGYNFVLLFSARAGQWLIPLAAGTMLYGVAAVSYRALAQELGQTPGRWAYGQLFFGVAAILLCVGYLSFWVIFSILGLLPLVLLFAYVGFHEEVSPWRAGRRTLVLINGAYARTVGLMSLLLVLGLLLFSFTNTIVIELLFRLVNWLVTAEQVVLDEWSLRLDTFLLVSITNFIWIIVLLGLALLYFTLREINEATDLKARVAALGEPHRIKGLERE